MSEERFVYTTAPEGYDYRSATTVERFECPFGTDTMIRKVRIAEPGATAKRVDFLAAYQMGRYASGLHFANTADPRER